MILAPDRPIITHPLAAVAVLRTEKRTRRPGHFSERNHALASISTAADGRKTIQFVGPDRKRRSIRLGKMPDKAAENLCAKVERLAAAQAAGVPPDGELIAWLAKASDFIHGKLAAVGLVESRQGIQARLLGEFVTAYIDGRTDVQPATRKTYLQSRARLVSFFGEKKPLRDITPGDADAWVIHMKAKYTPGTIDRTVEHAGQFFRNALRKKLIGENPFTGVKTSSQPDQARQRFIDRETARRVLDACPDAEWRLIFALCRYGGLRCPSELLVLTWADVDWDRGRFRVDSPKTGERWVPLFPELRPFLEEVYEMALEGALYVISRYRKIDLNIRSRLVNIIRRAGIVPWPKIFNNLRASRETELAAEYPLHVVCNWIGNSSRIAAKHYLQITEADFARAAGGGAEAVQNPVQHGAATVRTESQTSNETGGETPDFPRDAASCEVVREGQGVGPRTAAGHVGVAFGRRQLHRRQRQPVAREGAVVFRVVMVQTPLGDVAGHVVQAPAVGSFLADRVGLLVGVVGEPGVLAQLADVIAPIKRGSAAGPAGVFPLGLGGQPVRLAGLERQPAAVFHRRMMADADHGIALVAEPPVFVDVRRGGPGDGVGVALGGRGRRFSSVRGKRLAVQVEFVPGDLGLAHPEGAQADGVLRPFVGAAALFAVGAAHHERAGRDRHHVETDRRAGDGFGVVLVRGADARGREFLGRQGQQRKRDQGYAEEEGEAHTGSPQGVGKDGRGIPVIAGG
jgi:integrase